jgi:hypothetical protein
MAIQALNIANWRAVSSGATVSIRQWRMGTNNQSTSTTNITNSFSSATLAGSAIVLNICFSNDNGHISATPSDTKGNTYTLRAESADTTSNGDERFQVWVCQSAVALAMTDTITFSPSTDYSEMDIYEVTGTTGFLAGSGNNTGTGYQSGIGASASLSSGSIACGTGNCFLMGWSMNTLDNGTSPFYPTVAGVLTNGGQWFDDATVSPANAPLATWGYASTSNYGTNPVHFTSSPNSSGDQYVTYGIAFSR